MISQVLCLKREPDHCKDKCAVAIVLEDCVVGHVPYNLAKCMSQFLSRDANKGFARVANRQKNQWEKTGGKTKSRCVFCRLLNIP